MSEVVTPQEQPPKDDPEKSLLTASLPSTTTEAVKIDLPGPPQPSTIANGPAGHPLQFDSVYALPDANQPANDVAEASNISSADKEDEELYGTSEKDEGDGEKTEATANEKDSESDDDPFAGLEDVATMDLYDLANYTFGKRNEESKSRIMQDLPRNEVSAALEKRYGERGMRRSVGAVLLVHAHNFPHILLLQRTDGKGEYALPGGRLRPGESDEEGLQRKLTSKLRPSGSVSGEEEEQQQLDVGDKLCTWHAIDFTRKYYPYVPAHVTKPKEVLNVYAVSLPSKFMFAVPNNLQLVAVPLFELFNNSSTYGDVISAVPALLSRYHVNYC